VLSSYNNFRRGDRIIYGSIEELDGYIHLDRMGFNMKVRYEVDQALPLL
jgi:hypothetical protein